MADAAREAGIPVPQPERVTLGKPAAVARRILDKGEGYARAIVDAITAGLRDPSETKQAGSHLPKDGNGKWAVSCDACHGQGTGRKEPPPLLVVQAEGSKPLPPHPLPPTPTALEQEEKDAGRAARAAYFASVAKAAEEHWVKY
jgi:hypothetical protein